MENEMNNQETGDKNQELNELNGLNGLKKLNGEGGEGEISNFKFQIPKSEQDTAVPPHPTQSEQHKGGPLCGISPRRGNGGNNEHRNGEVEVWAEAVDGWALLDELR